MRPRLAFVVAGAPVPKQSFAMDTRGKGHGYRSDRVSAWQDAVAWQAKQAMQGQDQFEGDVAVRLVFTLPNRRRVDLDNLSKGCLDALNGICWRDDRQVAELHLRKRVGDEPGVAVWIEGAA